MIGRIIGSGRGIAGMVAYITHDQTSAGNRRPTTAERVAWTACLGIPTEGTELMVRAMQGLTADAPALKAMAGISARGRKLKNPYTHLVLSLARGSRGSTAGGDAVGRRRRARQHRSRRPPLRGLRRTHRHGLPARARRRQPRRPGNGPAVNLDQGATRRLSRWARAVRVGPRRHRRADARRTARSAGGAARPQASLPQERDGARAGPLDHRAAAPAATGEAGAEETAVTGRFHTTGPCAVAAPSPSRTAGRAGAGPADCRSRTGGAATRVAGLPGGAGAGAVHRRFGSGAAAQRVAPEAARRRGPPTGRARPARAGGPLRTRNVDKYSLGRVINTQHPFSDIQMSHICEILWVACAQHGCGLVV